MTIHPILSPIPAQIIRAARRDRTEAKAVTADEPILAQLKQGRQIRLELEGKNQKKIGVFRTFEVSAVNPKGILGKESGVSIPLHGAHAFLNLEGALGDCFRTIDTGLAMGVGAISFYEMEIPEKDGNPSTYLKGDLLSRLYKALQKHLIQALKRGEEGYTQFATTDAKGRNFYVDCRPDFTYQPDSFYRTEIHESAAGHYITIHSPFRW